MQELDDSGLLRQYVEQASEEAFAALIGRHINKVYSVALRHVASPHQAEEITQAVFIILARKSSGLLKHTCLSGWLYQTARLTSVTFVRSEIRRARREQEAYMQTGPNETESEAWRQIAPLLDSAIAGLGAKERDAIVLRFFDGKSMKDVGAALAVNEDAAKKRVNRAVEKLRKFFLKRGVVSTTAIIAGAMAANSVQAAPVVLAQSVTAVAIGKGAVVGSSTLTLIQGALKLMAWTKAKTAVATGVAAMVIVAAVTPMVIHQHRSSEASKSSSGLTTNSPTSTNPQTPAEATRAIFESLGSGDLNGFYERFGDPAVPRARYEALFSNTVMEYLRGVKVVSLGKATTSFKPNWWSVPYKLRFRDGKEKDNELHLEQDLATKRWILKGGI